MPRVLKPLWRGAVIVSLVALAGFFGGRYLIHRGEAHLMERVNAYWEAQQSNDLLTQYHFQLQAATGELWPDEFPRFNDYRLRVRRYEVTGVEVSGGMARIDLNVFWTMPDWNGQTFERPQREYWTFYEGDWYRGELEKGDWIKAHPELPKPADTTAPQGPVTTDANPKEPSAKQPPEAN